MFSRPKLADLIRQSFKSDSYYADEIINIYLLRPLAGVIVWLLYPTRITPNQVTVFAVIIGLVASGVYLIGSPAAIAIAGLLVTVKDILDDADGQLARARQQYSRRGRFFDSIGDFLVDIALFVTITIVVYRSHPSISTIVLGFLAFWGITLRVSYHVYYQASFLHRENRYKLNRITEEITEEDRAGDRFTLRLQQIFVLLYGWQDRLMARIDLWCKGKNFDERLEDLWYGDRFALRLSGLMGFGTELMLLTICSLLNELYVYLWLNVLLMNGVWVGSILYRKMVLRKNLL